MGQHDTSSLGGIAYNSRLRKELPIEGLNVLRQSGDYQGTEDADAGAMILLGASILKTENSAKRAKLLDQFDRLHREVPSVPSGNRFVRYRRMLMKDRIAVGLERALGHRGLAWTAAHHAPNYTAVVRR
jgi:hypothetical protein